MSDVDIEIRNYIQYLLDTNQPTDVETVQEILKASTFFTDRDIELVPAEWIETILAEGQPWPDMV